MQLPPAYFLRQALASYIALVKADDREMLDLYDGNPPAAIAAIRRFFASWHPIDIGPTYAKEDRALPALSVIGKSSTTIGHPVGGSLGAYWDADEMTVIDRVGTRDQGGVDIRIFAQSETDADILLTLVHGALRHFMFSLDDIELNEMEVSASDLTTDEETLAFPCYRYTVTATFTYWASVNFRYGNTPVAIEVSEPLPNDLDPTTTKYRYP
jgi:hypothetical protein